jgi:hypothetical protein
LAVTPEQPYPRIIRREEELDIRRVLDQVKNDGRSRAVLLYGSGGIGKTSLVRRMVAASTDPTTMWLDPIDVDDSHYWLLSNLETRIADLLDRPGRHFGEYKRQVSLLPDYRRENISRETVISHLGRVKDVFARCYDTYLDAEQKTVVIVFDTVETIRDTNLVSTLTQWMKALPRSTLFILSGRPVVRAGDRGGEPDPIRAGLDSLQQPIPVTELEMSALAPTASRSYVTASAVSRDLVNEEREKLVVLTRGEPLWLAVLIDYLLDNGIPEEAEQHTLGYLERNLPFGGSITPEGERVHLSFQRSLIAPYRQSDFWHEAIKRLAVVRQPIELRVWRELMADLALPADAESLDAAWDELLRMPWIRLRGNGRFITLHDALAEALAQRLFPLHDPDESWRKRIWQRALDIYARLAAEKAAELQPRLQRLDAELSSSSEVEASALVRQSLEVDKLKREFDELKAIGLYYQFLIDFEQGCDLLLSYFEDADRENDLFIQDLLVLYLQRFLPGGSLSAVFNDAIKAKIDAFHRWLTEVRRDYYVAIGLLVAAYFIDVSQPQAALELLDELPGQAATPENQYQMHILRGNACMRIPSRVREALPHFAEALRVAETLPAEGRAKFLARAHKEQGYYHRNIGEWDDADQSYKQAQDIMASSLGEAPSKEALHEIASIQTNWAYIKGLAGNYNEGTSLAEAAITLRRQVGAPFAEGASWSVCGEVYRYARRFEKAWDAYGAAERLLEGRPNWYWLGLLYQQQAICLYQAMLDGINLTADPLPEAERLITNALDVCLSRSIRGYPSALNRAGRIFGHADPAKGIPYLEKGITEAKRLSDGWFLFANLMEYAELCYRAWQQYEDNQYLARIVARRPEIEDVARDSNFPDLAGRWTLLRAHLELNDYRYNRNEETLRAALQLYRDGFVEIAGRSIASSGAASLPYEFEKFRLLFRHLPTQVQADWQTELAAAWLDSGEASTLLLARLQEMIARLRAPT